MGNNFSKCFKFKSVNFQSSIEKLINETQNLDDTGFFNREDVISTFCKKKKKIFF